MIRTIALSLVVFVAAALPAAASTIEISQTSDLAGFVTNDFSITTTGTWSRMELLTNGLSAGDIFQHSFGTGNGGPNPALVAAFADLAFDSFLANGTLVDDAGHGILAIGGAVDLVGGAAPLTFTDQMVDATWGPALGQNPTNVEDWLTARITVADTANGTFQVLFSDTSKGVSPPMDGVITNGTMTLVPEPSTFLMLTVGSLGLLLLRRRRNG